MTELRFTLPIEPKAQQRPRYSRWGAYKSKSQQAHDAELDCQLLCHVPDSPLCGPVSVFFVAYMPIPASTPKRARARLTDGKTPHTKKTDVDNLAKMLLDRMTALHYWHDDGQVWELSGRKVYSDKPRWEVLVRQEENDV